MVICVTAAKILGLVYIFPLTGLIKDTGIGIYSNAYNLYAILLTLSTAGFPTAMGKLISERLALRRYADVEHLYRVTIRAVFLLGVVLFVVMWFGAPLYSYLIAIKDPSKSSQYIVWSVRAVAPCLLVVPAMSAMRGYLQGFQRMEPSAYSQALEQLIRVVAIVGLSAYVMHITHGNIPAGAAAATFAAFLGALGGLFLLSFTVIPLRRDFKRRVLRNRTRRASADSGLRTLLAVALPVCLGASVVPLSGLADSLTVQNFLMLRGLSLHTATAQYGILSRQAFQLIQLPLAFAMAVGASILPAISEAKALRNRKAIEGNIAGTLKSMFFITIPVAATLLTLGLPVDIALFGKTEGADIISSVSIMGIFSSLELISTYMLQGLGNMYRPVRNMFIGIVIKLVCNLVLILPFGILGAAVASTIGYLFSATLNVMAVKKYGNVQFSVWKLALPFIASGLILSGALVLCRILSYRILHHLSQHAWPTAIGQLVISVCLGGIIYLVVVIGSGAVTPEEMRKFPLVGSRLYRFSLKLQRIA